MPATADRVVILILLVSVLITNACFVQSSLNPNVRSRMFLTFALIEDHSPRIDKYANLTLDRAPSDGHYYSDKAPGQSLMAVPAVACTWWALDRDRPLIDAGGNLTPTFEKLTYVATVATSGLMAALAVVALYLLAIEWGASARGAACTAMMLAWATPLWGWATAFMGHAVSAGTLILGLLSLVLALSPRFTERHRILFAVGAGAALAAAVTVEFTSGGAVGLIVGYGIWQARGCEKQLRLKLVLAAAGAALVASLPLLAYNFAAFGSPLRFGYGHVSDAFPGMNEGLFGITAPSPRIIYELLWGRYRGLFWISPVSALAPVVGLALWRRPQARVYFVLCLAIPIYYLLINAGYAYWDGGWSTGPRHLTATLPFLLLPVALVWSTAGRLVRGALITVALVSGFLTLICVSTSMFAPDSYPDMLAGFIVPGFLAHLNNGELARPGAYAISAPGMVLGTWRAGVLALVVVQAATIGFVVARNRNQTVVEDS